MQIVGGDLYDYVDDHFYAPHPELPTGKPRGIYYVPNCNNATDPEFAVCRAAFARNVAKPFVATEFNFARPANFRGQGGLLTGAFAGRQDWSGLWRFAYAHHLACLPDGRLGVIADGLKKAVTWLLTTPLIAFTVYLSVVRVVSGSADSARVKVAKAAIASAVPVVGGIISEVSETVLAGAGMLKNTIGVFGMLAVLAACVYPFLQLGIQYLLYKLTAFLASAVGAPGLCKLIDGLGGAFGLVLGMTGACALLLLVSILASVSAVTP